MDVGCVLSDWMDKQWNPDGSSRVLFGSHSAQKACTVKQCVM